MLHARKGRADLTHSLHRHAPPDSGDGCQQVFDVVQPAQLDVGAGHNGRYYAVFGIAKGVVLRTQKRAVVGFVQAGEPDLLALAVALHRAGDVVLKAQHGAAGRHLPQQNIALGIDIFLHILVVIQVVGRDVGHHRHLGAGAHTDQLEAGQFDHRHSVRRNVRQLGQQRCADVAAQKHLAPGGLKHFGDQRGRGGLAVRAGHRHDLAGAKLKKQLHLAGHGGACLQRRLQFGLKILVARRAHNDILPGKAVGVMFAQTQADIQTAQGFGVVAEVLYGFFLVAQRDLRAHLHELFQAALVADARADKGNLFALNFLL